MGFLEQFFKIKNKEKHWTPVFIREIIYEYNVLFE